MSTPLFISKGQPYSFFVTLADGVPDDYDLADGKWQIEVKIRYQTNTGPEPFNVNFSVLKDGIFVELSAEQTAMLNHKGTGYIVLTKFNYDEGALVIINEFLASVANAII